MTPRQSRSAHRRFECEGLEPRTLLATSGGATLAEVGPAVGSHSTDTPDLDEFFVKFQANRTPRQTSAAIRAVGGTVVATYPDGTQLVEVASHAAVERAVQRLSDNPHVVYAQANATIQVAAAIYPNDPTFGYSWGLNNPNDVDIDAPEAWGITTGNPYTIVAVLDTGIDLSNSDMASRIWTNPYNDAAIGYPNDIHGWNFVANSNNVQDNNGHGTFVSSIIAAAGNNATGIAGVAWNVQIMPVKFLDANGVGSTDRAVSAIYYAVNHGAKVINASWGGIDFTQPLRDAVAYANAHNVVFVTAAGNEGTNNDVSPSYPASLRLPNELSVAAVDSNGQLPYFSNYGVRTVDLAAPGVSILGDYPTAFSANGLQVLSGTSMATAYVSGVAALLAGAHPELSAAQLVQRINATAKPLPGLAGKVITGGIVDASRALGATDTEVQTIILGSDEFYAHQGGTVSGFVTGLYQDLLARNPDQGGLAYWSSLITAGTVTRSGVASAFLTSPEGRATEVAGFYQTDLGRTTPVNVLKTDPGVLGWVQLINSGVSPRSVEAFILASNEYLQAHGASPAPVVAAWYQNVMGRPADAAGLATWAGFLWSGATPLSVIQAFQNTTEAKVTRVARWFTRYLGRPTTLANLKADPGIVALGTNTLST